MTGRCAIHPDRVAESTCARCGNFACYECIGSPSTICARCSMRGPAQTQRLVKILGALLIGHGAMIGALTLVYAMVGAAFPFVPPPPTQPGDPPPLPLAFVMGLMGAWALIHLVPCVLQLIAGIRLLRTRGRIFALVALCCGVMTMPGCYCIPTSIALGIFGFFVLLRSDAAELFDPSRQ